MQVSVVWLDPTEARLFHVSEDKMERLSVKLSGQSGDPASFAAIVAHLFGIRRILLVGPGEFKQQMLVFLVEQYPAVASRVLDCLPLGQPSDPDVAALALQYLQGAPRRNLA